MKWLALEADTVAAEEQTTADHVHRADDDCRASRVCRPFPVVGELTSQSAQSEWRVRFSALVRKRQRTQLRQLVLYRVKFSDFLQPASIILNLSRRLIDHRAPVNDIDQSSRNTVRKMRQCDQPNAYDRRFSKPRRQTA